MSKRLDPKTGYPAHGHALSRLRRRVTGWLTRPFRGRLMAPGEHIAEDARIERVLILRSNHRLGNQLLTTPLVREIHRRFPAARIDLLGRGGQVELVYRGFEAVGRIMSLPRRPLEAPVETWRVIRGLRGRRYDLLFHADGASSTGRVLTRLCRARYKLQNAADEDLAGDPEMARHIAGNLVLSLRSHLPTGVEASEEPVPTLSISLTRDELERGRREVAGRVSGQRAVLCLYTFATGDKRYDRGWWQTFTKRLTECLPDHELIEALPVENVSALDFQLPSFYSRSIRELGAFIARCDLFVTADCGIMHLASAVGVPTVGLFKASPPALYRPYNDGSLAIDTRRLDAAVVAEGVAEHAAAQRASLSP
jgi:ADP-heptose:LPS heptosyltransferase